MSKTVLFQAIPFSISKLFSTIWYIERTISSATTPGQCGPGSDRNDRVLHIPQSSSITGASPSDCFVSYQDTRRGSLTPPQRSSRCIQQPQPTGSGRFSGCYPLCLYRTDDYKSLPAGQHWCVSTGESCFWVCPCFSSIAQFILKLCSTQKRILVNIYLPTPPHDQDATKGHF